MIDEDTRVVQLTPPGSGCSIVVGKGSAVPDLAPGSLKGLQLVVKDIHEAHRFLSGRGVEVSDVTKVAENWGPGEEFDNVGFVWFSDPDGNGWAVQQISTRE